jgi:tetratricopeptide (TPR) repeat protein
MTSGRKMSLQEQAQLALFLANEGADYQGTQPARARTRYAQSLSVFRQLNAPNEAWVAFILFSLGQIKAQDQQDRQPLAFYESAVHVQRQLGMTQDVADQLRQYGQAAARLKAYTHALDWLGKALTIYHVLGIDQPARALWAEIRRLPAAQSDQLVPQPHDFEIRVQEECKERFRVNPDGAMQWTVGDLAQPTPLGLADWDVVCVDPG